MKRILFICALLIGFMANASAGKDRKIETNELPSVAQTFIFTNFPSISIDRASHETEFKTSNYNVWLSNGIQIEFDKWGEWTEIENKRGGSIPIELIPQEIYAYVTKNYPKHFIIGIERQKGRTYEVELEDGMEIKFNKKYQVVDIDD